MVVPCFDEDKNVTGVKILNAADPTQEYEVQCELKNCPDYELSERCVYDKDTKIRYR